MKKTIAMIAMLLMMPLAAQAKSTISDSDLGGVTGQAGVSINMDVNMDIHMDTAAWGDSDGIGGTTGAGWIGFKNMDVSGLRVRLRQDLLQTAYQGNVAAAQLMQATGTTNITDALAAGAADPATYGSLLAAIQAGSTASAGIKPLTIDVATDTDGSVHGAGTTFVRIGFGSLQIDMNSFDAKVALGADKTNLAQNLGSIYVGGMDLLVNGSSYVDIYKVADGEGVVLDFNATLDKANFAAMSWGDADGTTISNNTGKAGYVGLANMSIDSLKFKGPISINVATVDTNPVLALASATATMYAAYPTHQMGNSFVHIGLGTGNANDSSIANGDFIAGTNSLQISAASFNADVKVADNKQLNGGGTYGSMYASNFKLGVNGWVDIAAH